MDFEEGLVVRKLGDIVLGRIGEIVGSKYKLIVKIVIMGG